jgi:hypothetical protein
LGIESQGFGIGEDRVAELAAAEGIHSSFEGFLSLSGMFFGRLRFGRGRWVGTFFGGLGRLRAWGRRLG